MASRPPNDVDVRNDARSSYSKLDAIFDQKEYDTDTQVVLRGASSGSSTPDDKIHQKEYDTDTQVVLRGASSGSSTPDEKIYQNEYDTDTQLALEGESNISHNDTSDSFENVETIDVTMLENEIQQPKKKKHVPRVQDISLNRNKNQQINDASMCHGKIKRFDNQ